MWDSMGEEKREEWKQKAAERAREKGILADPSDSNSSRKSATTEASPKISRSELMKRSLDSEPDKRDITFIVADVLIWCDAPNKGKTLPAGISLTKFSLNQVDMKPGRHLHVVEGSDSSAAVSHDWPAQTNGFESSWTKGAGALDPDTSTMTETDDMEDLNKRFGHFALEE